MRGTIKAVLLLIVKNNKTARKNTNQKAPETGISFLML